MRTESRCSGGNTWTLERCKAALDRMPVKLRQQDAYAYCALAGLGKHRGGALWAALKRHQLIIRTTEPVRSSRRWCLWVRVNRTKAPQPIVNNGCWAEQQRAAAAIESLLTGVTINHADLRIFGEGTKTQAMHFQLSFGNGQAVRVTATGRFAVDFLQR